MPSFVYEAVDGRGERSQGTLLAESRAAALGAVRRQGLTAVSVRLQESQGGAVPEGKREADARMQAKRASADADDGDANGWRRGWWERKQVSGAQAEAFTRELANLLEAGVPMGRALQIMKREASGSAARRQWAAVHDDVVGGKSLAEALGRWPGSFAAVYVAMIRAGELGGFLDVVLHQIADFRARESELLGRVKAAMVYPAVLAVLAVVVVIGLLTFFIPRFALMFADFGAALPMLTQLIVAASALLTKYGWLLLIGMAAAGYGLKRWMQTESGERRLERVMLGLPGVGVIVARFALVRFARMLGTLLKAGVPMVTALRVAREAIGNQTLADAVSKAIEDVKEGSGLARSLGKCEKLFPPGVVEMVAVAEESGRLDKELLRLAQTYEVELDRRLRMLVSLAEPMLLFAMAAVIGTIVIGMLLPIFTLQELIQ